MKRNAWRLLTALIISVAGYAGAEIWYKSGQKRSDDGSKTAVALLNESTNEVQRKPKARVIWESISRNDELFAGEAVRTASDAEAKIYLKSTGATIFLEPDSLIVLEENDKGLSLDFLQGNMMVAGGEGDLTVKTGASEIKLKSAEMSLSKDQSGKVDLEMYKGQAELSQGEKKIALDNSKAATLSEKGVSVAKDVLKVLSPKPGDAILLNLIRGDQLEIAWQSLPEGYTVSADVGRHRSRLSRRGSVPGEKGKMKLPTKPGKWFLRLSAEAVNPELPKYTSVIVPFEVQPKTPPSLLEPAKETAWLKKSANEPVAFKWLNRHAYQSQILEVAKDQSFKNVVVKQTLTGTDNSFSGEIPDGQYFWRVTGYLNNNGQVEGLSSLPSPFSVVSNWEVKPPKIKHPAPEQRLSFVDVQRAQGVNLKWEPAEGVKRYRVFVQKHSESGTKEVLNQTVEAPLARITNPTPGTYLWKVSSIDPKDGSEKSSEVVEFKIDELPPIRWVEMKNNTYEYTTPTPSLVARWEPLEVAPATYRYRVVAEGNSLQEAKWQTTKQTLFDIPLPNEGDYLAVVEALNANGQAIAASEIRLFTIKPAPLLPAPQWAENLPPEIKSDARGNLSLSWKEVDGAANYLMILENDAGQVVEQRTVTRTTASITRLKPGEYQVQLKAVDTHKRPGLGSPPKKLTVPNVSDIKAPKIKSMKVN